MLEKAYKPATSHYRVRYYIPALGRFLQEDPDPGILENPITFNSQYSYVGNNTLRFTDPSGESYFDQMFQQTVGNFLNDAKREATQFWNTNGADIISTGVVAGAIVLAVYSGGAASGALMAGGVGGLATMALSGNYSYSSFIQGAAGGVIGYAAFSIGAGAGSGSLVGSILGGGAGSFAGVNATSQVLHGKWATERQNFMAIGLGMIGGGVMYGFKGTNALMNTKDAVATPRSAGEATGGYGCSSTSATSCGY